MLPLQAGVDLGAMSMKGHSVFLKAPALLEPHHQILTIIFRTLFMGLYPSAEVQLVYFSALFRQGKSHSLFNEAMDKFQRKDIFSVFPLKESHSNWLDIYTLYSTIIILAPVFRMAIRNFTLVNRPRGNRGRYWRMNENLYAKKKVYCEKKHVLAESKTRMFYTVWCRCKPFTMTSFWFDFLSTVKCC